ncbi:MAG: CoA activase, partial [Candidatus Riflebacteria bacterium]|nr:CoA activase [Candidatus Riflebacteria bacterium]
ASGRLFGLVHLLSKAAAEFAAIVSDRELPTVLVTGEMYVRCDEFSNDFTIRKLEERGIRTRLSPFNEWLEYVDRWNVEEGRRGGFGAQISSAIQRRIQRLTYQAVQKRLGWPARTTVKESVAAAAPYIRRALGGEAVLTLGGAVHEWREGVIDGVVSIGPLECMPNKIAESQFFHVAGQEGLLSLTLPLNGDPIDPEVLDTFAFEVHARCRARQAAAAVGQQTGKLHGV